MSEANIMQQDALEQRGLHNRRSASGGRIDAPLSAVLIELQARREAMLPATLGHQVHAMFLHLVARTDPALSARLHNEPGYRPFTLSPLLAVPIRGEQLQLSEGQICYIRITLLDGGSLWHCLSVPLLEGGPLDVRLGEVPFKLTRLLSTPGCDKGERIAKTSWNLLSKLAPVDAVTLSFESPTAFNINGTYFALFPEPLLVWDSLIRVWNNYAPGVLHIEKQAMRDFLQRSVSVAACNLSTRTLHYPKFIQKGFCGRCTYTARDRDERTAQFTRLAAFAPFAGMGYKTTMGMGQVRAELHEHERL
jgi:CRISPR-associated endoribonuclease Cas6